MKFNQRGEATQVVYAVHVSGVAGMAVDATGQQAGACLTHVVVAYQLQA
jgi:hypothetical protein